MSYVKPGWQSTEWWTTILTQLLAAVAVLHPGFDTTRYQPIASAVAVIAGAVATGLYSLSRGRVKAAANATVTPITPPAVPVYHSAFAPTLTPAATAAPVLPPTGA